MLLRYILSAYWNPLSYLAAFWDAHYTFDICRNYLSGDGIVISALFDTVENCCFMVVCLPAEVDIQLGDVMAKAMSVQIYFIYIVTCSKCATTITRSFIATGWMVLCTTHVYNLAAKKIRLLLFFFFCGISDWILEVLPKICLVGHNEIDFHLKNASYNIILFYNYFNYRIVTGLSCLNVFNSHAFRHTDQLSRKNCRNEVLNFVINSIKRYLFYLFFPTQALQDFELLMT